MSRQTDAPAKFYKYRSMSGEAFRRTESIVLNSEIYFSAAAGFNDPFDLRPSFSFIATPDEQRQDYIRMSRKFQPHLSESEHQAEADRVMARYLYPGNLGAVAADTRPGALGQVRPLKKALKRGAGAKSRPGPAQ